jgi:hypothetical protein
VRLEDSLTNRLRGGSFTGISAAARPATIVYRDRLLEIDGTNSNKIVASRKGDHADFDYSGDVSDTIRATFFQFSEDDKVGENVVALVPHKDSFLLGFAAGETWIQQGDPLTGTRRRVSDEVGIIGADAWCVNHDTAYFMSSSGLYSVGMDGSSLKPVSEDRIPEDLTGVSDSTCKLTYNHADRGVYVTLASGVSWFYDTARDQFWPFTGDTDSHVLVGPFRLGQAESYGRVLNLQGVIAAGSADVNWRLVTGESAEEAAANGKAAITAALAANPYDDYVDSEGTWSAGRARMAYPRIRAIWCCLWLASEGTWAYEGVSVTTLASGRWR